MVGLVRVKRCGRRTDCWRTTRKRIAGGWAHCHPSSRKYKVSAIFIFMVSTVQHPESQLHSDLCSTAR